MDEAFIPASEMVSQIVSIDSELVDREAGIRFWIHQLDIEMPVELSISRDAEGRLQIGSTPPLYYVDTSFRPSYHRVSLTAVSVDQSDAD